MEAKNLDPPNLNMSAADKENLESEVPEMNTEKPKKKIIGVALLEDLPILYDLHRTKLPLLICLDDGIEKVSSVPFDIYFLLVNKFIWNHPDYAKNVDLITMENRMKDAAPYNVFFNTLKYCPETKDQLYSISFTDLLCPSFGKLKCSFHITFMADIKWIIAKFALRKLHKLPMTIIHGSTSFPWPKDETMEQLYPDIDYHFIEKRKETDLGCHHTKLSIFVYEDDSLRVVIGSANLYAEDWDVFNEQLWISPPCPKLAEGSSVMSGESPTGFKFALLDYLFTYMKYDIPKLQEWIDRVKNADFSEVKVALIFCVPGLHYPRKNGSLLHFMGHLLSRDCTIPAPKEEHDSWRVVAQTSALGLIGKDPDEWLTTHLLKAFGSHKGSPYLPTLRSVSKTEFNLIFPTVQNTRDGYLEIESALCCPYEKGVKEQQPWLLRYKCQWKADGTKRTRAISHSKCYCRISPCWQKMAYYFLTSANMSRSAWGTIQNQDSGVYVRSFEMGVLFLPKYFGEEYFEIKDSLDRKNKKLFPMMFDLPLIPYGPDDDSICYEELRELDDSDSEQTESEDTDDDTEDKISKSDEKDNKKSPTDVSENKDVPLPVSSKTEKKTETVYKWDVDTNKDTQITGTKKRDMKFNVKPNTDMFFPSFSKKS